MHLYSFAFNFCYVGVFPIDVNLKEFDRHFETLWKIAKMLKENIYIYIYLIFDFFQNG